MTGQQEEPEPWREYETTAFRIANERDDGADGF
jgi:hypothetical protein